MNSSSRIGHSEILALVIIYMGTKVYLGLPRTFVEIGGTAGWMLPVLSGFLALPLWLLIFRLLERFPGQNIAQINYQVLGPLLGTGLNILFIIYYVFTSGSLLRQFGEAVILTSLPEAPISSLVFLFIIPMALAVYLGIEPIIRAAYIASPFVIFGTVGMLFALIPSWDFVQIYPLLGNGLPKLALYALPFTSVFSEVLILGILAPFFAFDSKKLRQIGSVSIIIIALFFSFSTLIYQIVIPYPGATESLLPYYQLARSIYLGRFFQRVESIFVLFWIFSAFLRLSVGVFIGAYLYKETFQIKYLHPLVPAMAIIYLTVSLTPGNLMQTVVIEKYRLLLGSLAVFGGTLGILAVAFLRGKGTIHEKARK